MHLPYIPTDAPFSGDQRAWLSGFLAGLHSRAAMMPAATAPAEVAFKPLDILYGTQTGNAEGVANDAAALARTRGFAPRVAELDAVDMARLAQMDQVVIVISTYGEGEMPDNAHQFWDALSAEGAPRLERLSYGILALGDTGYEHFCQAGKLIDMRLEQLGARRMGTRVDCDVDFEDAAANWLSTTVPTGGAATPAAPAPAPQKSGYTRKNPYPARLIENRLLSGAHSAKEIRHFAFALPDSGLEYEAGDALGVMPINAAPLVQGWLNRLAVQDDAALVDRLTHRLEIRTPSRELVAEVEKRAGNAELSHIIANGDKEALDAFLWGRDALDLLNLIPGQLDSAEVLTWLKPLQHRAYSISSSPNAYPGEVHLTVAAVRWMRAGRAHGGVCSTYLAGLADQAPIFMSPNKNFRVPADNSLPMIMVGPGTGIAPFRAFLQERQARGATGANWLFFGDQHRASDFIYEDEIGRMSESGLLTRLDLAFSRDQAQKVYVQTRMEENGKALFAMLQEGGHFYVCGDATRMARDVDASLHRVIETHGALSPEAATEYVSRLKREKRYVRDVY
ncbi:diflavin oxidoreductase [Ketogulonicigenium vulgare]|uniref:assimilatory sulfite reductase (NADPH) n=1 Tax=Ketogulonicigenium vulgare (strain WSH-001) TaxID=759362 RepID=F9YBA4_KETVW|nr:sulfite reductase flavoprotein subunit alpha [Ketogulonicigenium vulgare]ADO44132.1 putative NADPH--sulfite reductase flavoprotein alpha-component [Ketogulonicigenium vulgare Y25]AEM42656.1 Sulfite reductase [NADPH] flavoprotein alpha-component [Ketogulonicigenium vulgare WSH-001]ALJ82461.1 CysJ [Ketogulonicigenium vulgare]ANW35247.1 sulfite reductase subunit alpha [Ketogulonicigenium vulgare]AOZ53358.1 sulfite reductase NADPH flavoprotein alpha-component [Ketogulonicigenium vulgare]